MAVQHTFQVPEGVTVYAFDDFPPCWEIALYRSEDGTPVVDVMTTDVDLDHDADGSPHVRIYLNEAEVYEHMSARARVVRDERAATWAVFLRHRSQQAAQCGRHRPPMVAAAPRSATATVLPTT